jgi:hypothetical protein
LVAVVGGVGTVKLRITGWPKDFADSGFASGADVFSLTGFGWEDVEVTEGGTWIGLTLVTDAVLASGALVVVVVTTSFSFASVAGDGVGSFVCGIGRVTTRNVVAEAGESFAGGFVVGEGWVTVKGDTCTELSFGVSVSGCCLMSLAAVAPVAVAEVVVSVASTTGGAGQTG